MEETTGGGSPSEPDAPQNASRIKYLTSTRKERVQEWVGGHWALLALGLGILLAGVVFIFLPKVDVKMPWKGGPTAVASKPVDDDTVAAMKADLRDARAMIQAYEKAGSAGSADATARCYQALLSFAPLSARAWRESSMRLKPKKDEPSLAFRALADSLTTDIATVSCKGVDVPALLAEDERALNTYKIAKSYYDAFHFEGS